MSTDKIDNDNISLGLFAYNLVRKFQNKDYDEEIITKATTGQNETNNSEGGYLVNYDICKEFLASAQQGSVLYNKAKKIPAPKYGIKIPFINETARTNDSAVGIRAYFVGEGEQKTISYARWDARNIQLQKLVIRIPATWEILESVDALDAWLVQFGAEKISWYVDYAMFYGTTRVEGIFSIGANGVIGAASADPLTLAVLRNFEKKIAPANSKKAEWYFSKENWNDITDLVDDTKTNPWLSWTSDGTPVIFGHKVNIMEQLSGDEGIVLGDFSQYVVTEVEIRKHMSVALRWNYNEEELILEVRFGGCSYGNVYTMDDGEQVAPFVIAEGTGPTVSSSSSSESAGNVSSSSTSSASTSSASSEITHSSNSSSSLSSQSVVSLSSDSSESLSTEIYDSSTSSASSVSSSSSSSKSQSSASTVSQSSASTVSQSSASTGSSQSESSVSESTVSESTHSSTSESSVSESTVSESSSSETETSESSASSTSSEEESHSSASSRSTNSSQSESSVSESSSSSTPESYSSQSESSESSKSSTSSLD
uniref:Putative capsid protein n=1 Tax=viral metagenome TaxID=1070528 RepID=A0A6M3KSU2_9ZZZZ